MYAVIKTGGKQFKVEIGDKIYVEKLKAEDNTMVSFDVLAYANEDENDVRIGTPLVEGVTVEGRVVRQAKGRKIVVFMFKSKKDVRKKRGHRQPYTQVEITGIKA